MNQAKNPTPKAESRALSLLERLHRLFLSVGFVLTSLALLTIAISIVMIYLAKEGLSPAAVSVLPAGRVTQVQLFGGFFSRSFVETDLGYFSLAEGGSFAKGEAVTLEQRASGSRHLCDSRHYCTPLLQSLQPLVKQDLPTIAEQHHE